MGRAEAITSVGRLASAYGLTLEDSRVNVYVDMLHEINPAVLDSAVTRVLERSKFFPSIAEIRESVLAVCGLLPPSAAQVLALVRQADKRVSVTRRDGSFAYEERFWDWPESAGEETIAMAQATLEKVGEPCDSEGQDHFGWENGFQKTYESVAQEATSMALRNIHLARLPKPAEPLRIEAPKEWAPGGEDQPLPKCTKCGKNFAFVPRGEENLCFFCAGAK